MPVTGTPAPPRLLSRDDIRFFMRDFAGKIANTGVENILLDNVEFSDDDIERSIRFTVSRYNAMTPISTIGPESLNEYVLLMGACCHLLRSEAFRQLRNQASATNGDGQPLGIDDKTQLYQALADRMSQDFEQYARGIKTQRNMESAYGGLGSGYVTAARRFSGAG